MKRAPVAWKCHAKPAALGGKMCGHENTAGIWCNGVLCCEGCGATKRASDDRERRKDENERRTSICKG